MKQLAMMARNISFAEYISRFPEKTEKPKLRPLIEVVVTTVETFNTPGGSTEQFENFRFVANADSLREFGERMIEYANDADADLERLIKRRTKEPTP